MAADAVTFSVVIPTFRRPTQLAACLRAVRRLDYPSQLFEVIIVDDGGGLRSDILAPFDGEIAIHCLTQPNAGPAAARNTGAARASNRYLAFTDDDCMPDPEWLRRLAFRLDSCPDHMLGGRTVNALPDNPFATTSQLLVDYLYEYYSAAPGRQMFFTSNNLALPVASFRSLGGFDATFRRAGGEDREFCARWRQAALPLSYVPDAIVRHAHRMGWRGFWRQHFGYGRAAYQYHRRRAQAMNERFGIEPWPFYWRLLWASYRRPDIRRKGLIALLLCLTQAANALGYLTALTRHAALSRNR